MVPPARVAPVALTVRLLSDGPPGALRDAVLGLGTGPAALATVASAGVVEALAVSGLRHDETRVVESHAQSLGLRSLSDSEGTRLVLLGPLLPMAELPGRLREWGAAGEGPAAAIAGALQSRGASLTRWELGGCLIGDGRVPVSIGSGPGADIDITRIARRGNSITPGADAALVLRDVAVADDPERDRVLADLAVDLASAAAEDAAGVSGFALSGPRWLVPRLGQLRPLGLTLVWDCRDGSLGASVAAAVLGAGAGLAGVISLHPAEVRDALRAWAESA